MMNTELSKRNMIVVVLLYLFTYGIYPLYIFFVFGYELKNESLNKNTKADVPAHFVAFTTSIFTLGLYNLYNVYQQAKALKELSTNTDYDAPSPSTVLLLSLFGIGYLININSASKIALFEESQTL